MGVSASKLLKTLCFPEAGLSRLLHPEGLPDSLENMEISISVSMGFEV